MDKSFYIYERYADDAAVKTHMGGFAPFAEQFMAACVVTRFWVYGNPNEETQNGFMPFNPICHTNRRICKIGQYRGMRCYKHELHAEPKPI